MSYLYHVNQDQSGYYVERLYVDRWLPVMPHNFRHDVVETAIDAIMELTADDENPPSRADIQVVQKSEASS